MLSGDDRGRLESLGGTYTIHRRETAQCSLVAAAAIVADNGVETRGQLFVSPLSPFCTPLICALHRPDVARLALVQPKERGASRELR